MSIEIRSMENEEFDSLYSPLSREIFLDNTHMYMMREILSDDEQAN